MRNLLEKGIAKQEIIQMRRLDEFIEENNVTSMDFTKCDVEGSELTVFQGGMEKLSQFKLLIICEMFRKLALKYEYYSNEIINLLSSISYKCFYILKEELKEITQVDEQIKETNFSYLHEEQQANIIRELVY